MLKKTVQQGRRQVETGGVPSGTLRLSMSENEAVGLFQHPASGLELPLGLRLEYSDNEMRSERV